MTMISTWTPAEDARLLFLAEQDGLRYNIIGQLMNRTTSAVTARLRWLRSQQTHVSPVPDWQPSELAALLLWRSYGVSTAEICGLLPWRDPADVSQRLQDLVRCPLVEVADTSLAGGRLQPKVLPWPSQLIIGQVHSHTGPRGAAHDEIARQEAIWAASGQRLSWARSQH